MLGWRHHLIAITTGLVLVDVASTARAGDAPPQPAPAPLREGAEDGHGARAPFPPPAPSPPLHLAPIDLATFELGAGAIGATDGGKGGSSELTLGFLLARAQLLGLSASALTFRAAPRPSLQTWSLEATFLTLDEMMFGSRYPDKPVCPAWPTEVCDDDTGFIGIGGSLLSFHADTDSHRNELRLGELDAVFSVTPAFNANWSHVFHLLPRIGLSIDWLSRAQTDRSAWVGRAMAGFDLSVAAGPLFIAPSFRWRPSLTAFAKDYALEPRLEVYGRTAWPGWHGHDGMRIGVELGYTRTSIPGTAFGMERVAGAENTLYARLVVAPALFTFGPP